MPLKKLWTWFTRITPLRIAMVIALLSATMHLLLELETFEFGPFSKKGFIHLLNLRVLDAKIVARHMPEVPPPQVVIAAIDERSIEKYGLWPWNRRVIAELIDSATKGGAKAIAFDMVFADEDRNSSFVSIKRFSDHYAEKGLTPDAELGRKLSRHLAVVEQALRELETSAAALDQRIASVPPRERPQLVGALRAMRAQQKKLQQGLAEARAAEVEMGARSTAFAKLMSDEVALTSPDEALTRAIAASDPTILGYFFFQSPHETALLSTDEIERDRQAIEKMQIREVFDVRQREIDGALIEEVAPAEMNWDRLQIRKFIAPQAPLKRLADAAKSLGFFNAEVDPDGQIRNLHMFFKDKDRLFPALSLLAAAKMLGTDIRPLNDSLFAGEKLDGVMLGDRTVPTNRQGRLLVNYYKSPVQYFPLLPIADIIDGTVKPEQYEGKVMLVGATAMGTYDIRPTPFGGVPGVYTHAAAIQSMVDGIFIERYFGLAAIEMLALLVLGLLIGLVLPRIPIWAGTLATLVLAASITILDNYVIFPTGVWVQTVLPTLQTFFSFAGIVAWKYFTEGKEKRQIRKAFQFYLSKNVVDDVLNDTSKLKLGGERKICTVLFSDIRGFTTLSEQLQPEELVALLNNYLTPMTDLVFKYDGTLDKYMGDAIMAIFGAPVNYPDHAVKACFTALEMMEELHVLTARWKEQGIKSTIDIGIGLNTGPMAAGNMGSSQRFDYTVMGDMVNLGSRLEGINKEYGTNIIISEFTFEAAKNAVHARELDLVKVKGKHEPVRIYELVGKGAPDASAQAWMTAFHEGLLQYRAQQWDAATATFKRVHEELRPGDKPSRMYLERIHELRANPPAANWDGVFTMTHK